MYSQVKKMNNKNDTYESWKAGAFHLPCIRRVNLLSSELFVNTDSILVLVQAHPMFSF